MPTYLVVVKGSQVVAAQECNKRGFKPEVLVKDNKYEVTLEVSTKWNDYESTSNLNKWFCESGPETCERGKGFPVGSLLFWNPTLNTMIERRKTNV